jgi:uncharacterized protein (DUF488 family)
LTKIFTIGFTKKSLQEFIELLRRAGARTVIDVRLRNTSQLAGWSRSPDFAYLLEEGFGMEYEHHPEFAPAEALLDAYKENHDWRLYEEGFRRLLAERNPTTEARALLRKERICLLCSEPSADRCHRRLVAEYLASFESEVEIEHL